MRGKGLVVGRWQQRGRQEHALVKKCEPQRSRSFNKSNSLEVKIRNIDDSESLLDFKLQGCMKINSLPLVVVYQVYHLSTPESTAKPLASLSLQGKGTAFMESQFQLK